MNEKKMGAPPLSEQIANLWAKLNSEERNAARQIRERYSLNTLRLALKGSARCIKCKRPMQGSICQECESHRARATNPFPDFATNLKDEPAFRMESVNDGN